MKFSVIVPVYKVEEFLADCVESILSQDYSDFEVILVDDGSPDRCPELCDQLAEKDSRIKVIHKENGGLSDARNAGIRAAEGEYLCFVDSDDFWSCPQVLTKVAAVIRQTGATLVQYGRQHYLNREKRFSPGPERDLEKYNGKFSLQVLEEVIARGDLTISACSMAVSTAFLREHQGYFTKGIKSEDIEWAIRLYAHEPVWAFCNENFYVYRTQREGSITASIDYKHLCDYCWILDSNIALLETNPNPCTELWMSYMMYHVLIMCGLCYFVKLEKKQRKEILNRLKAVCKGRITRYKVDNKVKLASKIYNIFGFSVMAWVLGFYLNHRGR